MHDYSISPSGKIRYIEVDHGYDTPCWDWQMHRNDKGYARWRANGRNNPAHRLYYEHYKGPIPDGHHIDHLCRNRGCVNPDHLEPVTPAENIRRGKGTKLSRDQVAAIRQMEGERPAKDVAAEYGVHRSQIQRIWRGQRWQADNVVAVNKNIRFLYRILPDSRMDSRTASVDDAKTPMESMIGRGSGARGGTVTAGDER